MEVAQQCLEYLVKLMVSNPDEVRVESSKDEMGVLLSVHVARSDMGKVIGRNGATANALRVITRNVGAAQQASVSIKIVEPEGSTHTPNQVNK